MKNYFEKLSQLIFKKLQRNEHLFLSLTGDDTQFIRINGSKVRQSGVVENYYLEFTFVLGAVEGQLRRGSGQITLSLDEEEDLKRIYYWVKNFRNELPHFPIDEFAELPANQEVSSRMESKGSLLNRDQAASDLLAPCVGVDLAGIYASGKLIRSMANSAGLFHWFETESFSFDFSLFTRDQKALKSGYAGRHWDQQKYKQEMIASIEKLKQLEIPAKKISKGDYRAYFAPSAVSSLLNMFSWGCMSELEIQKSQSPLKLLRTGEKNFSPKFSLVEDFSSGEVPRFNDEGEITELKKFLIKAGKLEASLIHSRTAKEFGLIANGANASESLRSAAILQGDLKESEILMRLGTGLYLSNLHYLNWSDQVNGRVTGMTRYACFWVENGKIIAPIENLRFDETLFDLFGTYLEDFTNFDAYIPENSSYHQRAIGGDRVPGMLVSKVHFTL